MRAWRATGLFFLGVEGSAGPSWSRLFFNGLDRHCIGIQYHLLSFVIRLTKPGLVALVLLVVRVHVGTHYCSKLVQAGPRFWFYVLSVLVLLVLVLAYY